MALAWPMMGFYFFRPNDSMFAFGGDALAIYYNMVYHVCHGEGTMLSSMNYPHGELVFLTDAQGALSTLLQWIHLHVLLLCDKVLGIANGLNVWSVIMANIFIFLVLRQLKTPLWIAALFSPLISLLSPQIIRINGHFGLAYPFLIPLSIWWYLGKKKAYEWKDLPVWFTLLFFTFNNPYAGTGPAALLLAAGFFGFFLHRPKAINLSAIAMGILTVLPALIYFKTFDPVIDRIQNQWGFFHYYATLEGLMAPPGSLWDRLLKGLFGMGFHVRPEARINIGWPTTILLLTYGLLSLTGKIKMPLPKSWKPLFYGATAVFVYTTAVLLAPFDQTFVEEKMGFLLMFKAVARLAWPIYFILTITAIWLLSSLRRKKLQWFVAVPMAIIWIWEIYVYMVPRFEGTVNWNYFSEERQQELMKPIQEAQINLSNYQAILCLPKTMFWTDNFISNPHFNTQFYAMRISAASGLPLVNAMLSRMSIGQTAEAIELLAHPLIDKSLPNQFPTSQPLLVVLGANHPSLGEGEAALIQNSTLLLQTDGYALYECPLSNINEVVYLTNPVENPINYQGWDLPPKKITPGQTWEGQKGYFQKGSLTLEKGTHLLLDQAIEPGNYTFSSWIQIDYQSHGVGNFQYLLYNTAQQLLLDTIIDTRTSNDVHDDWIRAEFKLETSQPSQLYIQLVTPRTQIIDDLLLRKTTTTALQKNEKEWLVNGYRVAPDKVRFTTPQVNIADPK
jgi:hypothetical protein